MKFLTVTMAAFLTLAIIGGSLTAGSHSAWAEDSKEVKKDKDGKVIPPEPKFVNLDPLTLPIIDDKGVTANVSIVATLQVADQEKAAEVTKQLPRLTDAYIQNLYGILNKHAAYINGVVQVDMVKLRLNQIAKKVFGDDTVQDVLLQVVSQRAI